MSQPDTTTLAGRIAVEQAALDGKTIQNRKRGSCDNNEWGDCQPCDIETFLFDWRHWHYRIKPPEPLRCLIVKKGADGPVLRITSYAPCLRPGEVTIEVIQLTPEVEAALKAAGIV